MEKYEMIREKNAFGGFNIPVARCQVCKHEFRTKEAYLAHFCSYYTTDCRTCGKELVYETGVGYYCMGCRQHTFTPRGQKSKPWNCPWCGRDIEHNCNCGQDSIDEKW